jgi:glycosyltransferase involved in cell wall biosynthesis
MNSTLFLGHGKTEMRGGPAIFMSIYTLWPDEEKYLIYGKSYFHTVKKLIIFTRHRKISTLILENEYFTEVFLALLLKIFNRKLNVYGPAYHIPSPPELEKGAVNSLIHYIDYKLGLFLMVYLYSGIYTENSYMKNYIKGLNPKMKVIVESPGIKKENIVPLQKIKDFHRDIDFLYLTSMTRNKGIYDFLHMIKQVQTEHNVMKICIAGYASTETLNYINSFVKNNAIENIEIYSNINEEEKYKLYSRSKIYVLPSIEDGIPITFYEAWSHGDVVIAYNLETYSDISDYFIGVRKGDTEDLTKICENAYMDYDLQFKNFFEKSYNYSMQHSYEKGIEKIIKNMLESTNSVTPEE